MTAGTTNIDFTEYEFEFLIDHDDFEDDFEVGDDWDIADDDEDEYDPENDWEFDEEFPLNNFNDDDWDIDLRDDEI